MKTQLSLKIAGFLMVIPFVLGFALLPQEVSAAVKSKNSKPKTDAVDSEQDASLATESPAEQPIIKEARAEPWPARPFGILFRLGLERLSLTSDNLDITFQGNSYQLMVAYRKSFSRWFELGVGSGYQYTQIRSVGGIEGAAQTINVDETITTHSALLEFAPTLRPWRWLRVELPIAYHYLFLANDVIKINSYEGKSGMKGSILDLGLRHVFSLRSGINLGIEYSRVSWGLQSKDKSDNSDDSDSSPKVKQGAERLGFSVGYFFG